MSKINFIDIFYIFIPVSFLAPKYLFGFQGLNESNNSYKPIANTAWARARLYKLKKKAHSTRSHM